MKKQKLDLSLSGGSLTESFKVSEERYIELCDEIRKSHQENTNWGNVIADLQKQCKNLNEIGLVCYVCGALSESSSFSMLSMLEQMMKDDD